MQGVQLLDGHTTEFEDALCGGRLTVEDQPLAHRHSPVIQPPDREEYEIDHGARRHQPRADEENWFPGLLAARPTNTANHDHKDCTERRRHHDVQHGKREEIGNWCQEALDNRINAGGVPALDQMSINWRQSRRYGQHNHEDPEQRRHPAHYQGGAC